MKPEPTNLTGTTTTPASFTFIKRHAATLLCILLLASMGAVLLANIRQKSITVDETVMIPAGYYHLKTKSFRPINEHPPLAKLLGGLPLLWTKTETPAYEPEAPRDETPYWYFRRIAHEFWRANESRYETLTFWSRVPLAALTLALGAFIFIYTRRLFGARAAVLAVALFVLEPTMLAHGRVVQTDVPSALTYLLFSFALYDYVKRQTPMRAVLVGMTLALALVTKFSMLALVPVTGLALLALWWHAPHRGLRRADVAAQALALLLTSLLVIHAAYFFQNRTPDPYQSPLTRLGLSAQLDERLHAPLACSYATIQKIFPADFISGINWQLTHARLGHGASILGQYSRTGWWYYFPVAFALKTTLPFLLLSLVALAWAVWTFHRRRETRWLVVLVPLIFFTTLLMLNSINIGVRYYLPAYPFLFIAGGAFLGRLSERRAGRGLMKALPSAVLVVWLAWTAWETARAYPHYMSYMNELACCHPRWYYLSDSNVEWGDDLRELALYLRERGEREVGAVVLNYSVLERYGIKTHDVARDPRSEPSPTRYVAIGASLLNGSTVELEDLSEEERVNLLAAYRDLQPEAIFGNSVYLFRMKE